MVPCQGGPAAGRKNTRPKSEQERNRKRRGKKRSAEAQAAEVVAEYGRVMDTSSAQQTLKQIVSVFVGRRTCVVRLCGYSGCLVEDVGSHTVCHFSDVWLSLVEDA